MQIDKEILAVGKKTIVAGQQHQASQKARELIQVQKLSQALRKLLVAGMGDKPRKIDHTALLFGVGLCLEIVDRRVSRPFVTQVLKKFVSDRLEQGRLFCAKTLRHECPVHVLDQQVKPQR